MLSCRTSDSYSTEHYNPTYHTLYAGLSVQTVVSIPNKRRLGPRRAYYAEETGDDHAAKRSRVSSAVDILR